MKRIKKSILLFRKGHYLPLTGLIIEELSGYNPYFSWLQRSADDNGLVSVTIHGYRVLVDPKDPGISRRLLNWGEWEPKPTRHYQYLLSNLPSTQNSHIIDIGSNRGYYAFLSAKERSNATVHAIEPVYENYTALTNGIEVNEFQNIRSYNIGIWDQSGKKSVRRSPHSNRHILVDQQHEITSSGDEIVHVKCLNDFIDFANIDPQSIDSIRLDVEGAETVILREKEDLLENMNKSIVFVEIHPHRVGDEPIIDTIETLESAGFDLDRGFVRDGADIETMSELYRHIESKPVHGTGAANTFFVKQTNS